MKGKKVVIIGIILLGCFWICNLCACSKNEPTYNISEAGTWKDGTYAEEATGKNGSFSVTVTIKDGKIENIEVGENNETADKGGIAISTLPTDMIANQTYNVDAVSGATITSEGLKKAVAKCLENASDVQ